MTYRNHAFQNIAIQASPVPVMLTLLQSGLSLSSEGILGPLTPDLPAEGLDLSEVPPAEEIEDASSD